MRPLPPLAASPALAPAPLLDALDGPGVHALAPGVPGETHTLDDAGVGRLELYASRPSAPAEETPVVLVHSVNAAASAYEVRPLFERLSASRPVWTFDLPGFGRSDRSDRRYTIRLMTDALHAVVAHVREAHGGATVDALALSLSSEYLARAANERPGDYRTLALVSPTGFDRRGRREGPPGSDRGMPWLKAALDVPLWSGALFDGLTRPGVVRWFLEKTFGQKEIDEGLWAYDVETAKQPGAKHAPLAFLAGYLFSNDVSRLYDALEHPVWMSHGVRGDFVDYRGADAMRGRPNWRITSYETGALPHFEVTDTFVADYEAFLADPPSAG